MRCEQFRELMSAYIEHSIEPPLAAKMEEHVAVCSACRAALEDLRHLWQMMAQAQPVEAPASLHARIMQEVYAKAPATPALRWWELAWRPRFAFAAAAVLVLVSLVLWSRNVQTDAVALSIVTSSGKPVAPVKSAVLPARFEPFRTDTGELQWMLKLSAAIPTAAEVSIGTRPVWNGVVGREEVIVLPRVPVDAPVLAVRVNWDNGSALRAWLPAEVAVDERKPAMVLTEKSIDDALAAIARAYGVPLVLVGEADPLTRVSIQSTGVALSDMLEELAKKLNLEISRAEDGTTVLTAR